MGVAAVATLTPIMAQAEPTPPAPVIAPEDDIALLQKNLAKPFIEAARPLLAGAIAYNRNNTAQRLKIKLPEGSEPCTSYIPMPKEQRTR